MRFRLQFIGFAVAALFLLNRAVNCISLHTRRPAQVAKKKNFRYNFFSIRDEKKTGLELPKTGSRAVLNASHLTTAGCVDHGAVGKARRDDPTAPKIGFVAD